jgi:hypothetical protein
MAMTCWLTVQLTRGRYSPRRVPVRPVIYGHAGQSSIVASMVSRRAGRTFSDLVCGTGVGASGPLARPRKNMVRFQMSQARLS